MLLMFSCGNQSSGRLGQLGRSTDPAVSSLATGGVWSRRPACPVPPPPPGGGMVSLGRPASSIRAAVEHAERVYLVTQGAAVPDTGELSSSWQRSTNSV